jgi:hypothetical protein
MAPGLPGRHISELAGSLKTCRFAAMLQCGARDRRKSTFEVTRSQALI